MKIKRRNLPRDDREIEEVGTTLDIIFEGGMQLRLHEQFGELNINYTNLDNDDKKIAIRPNSGNVFILTEVE